MLRLHKMPEQVTIQLPRGAQLLCYPPTTALVYTARARADQLIVDLQTAGEAVTKAGARIDGLPDLDTAEGLAGNRQTLFVLSIAELAAFDWSGIGDDDGKELAFDPALLALLFVDAAVADSFQSQYLQPIYQGVAEGNA